MVCKYVRKTHRRKHTQTCVCMVVVVVVVKAIKATIKIVFHLRKLYNIKGVVSHFRFLSIETTHCLVSKQSMQGCIGTKGRNLWLPFHRVSWTRSMVGSERFIYCR